MALTELVQAAKENATVRLPPFIVGSGKPAIVFPLSLRSKPVPFISFWVQESEPWPGVSSTKQGS